MAQKPTQGYRRMFFRREETLVQEMLQGLAQVSLFQGFSSGSLKELHKVMHHRTYNPDEIIYYQHDPGLGFYIVLHGCVRLLMEDSDGSIHELGQVVEKEFFGDLSILGDFGRMETAQALTEVQVLGFFKPDLKALLKRKPTLGAAVMAALARHLAARQVVLMNHLVQHEGVVGIQNIMREHTQKIMPSSSDNSTRDG